MAAHKQVLWQTRLRFVIASVILALLLPYSKPTHAHAPEPPPFNLTRLVFETVAGDYGNIYNVIQDKDGFLWLAGINGALKYSGYEAETIYSGETVSALLEKALVRIDIGAVNRAIEAIRAHHPSMAEELEAMARDLQYGRILRMIRATRGETSPEIET
jgi:hypothetical protein